MIYIVYYILYITYYIIYYIFYIISCILYVFIVDIGYLIFECVIYTISLYLLYYVS